MINRLRISICIVWLTTTSVAILAITACTPTDEYDLIVRELSALDGSTLTHYYLRKEGYTTKTSGPHPQQDIHLELLTVYRVIYKLDEVDNTGRCCPKIETVATTPAEKIPRDIEAWVRSVAEVDGVSDKASNPEASEAQIEKAAELGFDFSRMSYSAQAEEGLWLMGFPPGSSNIQFCSLSSGKFYDLKLDGDSLAIWDSIGHRAILYSEALSRPLIGTPIAVRIWHYTTGKIETFKLQPPMKKDFLSSKKMTE